MMSANEYMIEYEDLNGIVKASKFGSLESARKAAKKAWQMHDTERVTIFKYDRRTNDWKPVRPSERDNA
jgi:hypothetical protein